MRTFAPMPVIYVIGNHEPYNRVLEHFEDDLERKCAGTNVMYCRHPGRRIDIGTFGSSRRRYGRTSPFTTIPQRRCSSPSAR